MKSAQRTQQYLMIDMYISIWQCLVISLPFFLSLSFIHSLSFSLNLSSSLPYALDVLTIHIISILFVKFLLSFCILSFGLTHLNSILYKCLCICVYIVLIYVYWIYFNFQNGTCVCSFVNVSVYNQNHIYRRERDANEQMKTRQSVSIT